MPVSLAVPEPFAAASRRDSVENTALYEFVPPPYALTQPGQTPDEVGTVRDANDSLDQHLDRLLSEQGIPSIARKMLKQKWRADLSAAKGEITRIDRVAPISQALRAAASVDAALLEKNIWAAFKAAEAGTALPTSLFAATVPEGVQPHALPPGIPPAKSSRRVSELSELDRQARRDSERAKKARYRAKHAKPKT